MASGCPRAQPGIAGPNLRPRYFRPGRECSLQERWGLEHPEPRVLELRHERAKPRVLRVDGEQALPRARPDELNFELLEHDQHAARLTSNGAEVDPEPLHRLG